MSTELDSPLFDLGLPKWPQMRVEGHSITVEQAKEIIRRTDGFFTYPDWSGNDKAYCQRVMEKLGIPATLKKSVVPGDIGESWAAQDAWRTGWGFVDTEYVKNNWISCAFIHGPHGWCHPDGTISYLDNVGKWPSVRSIYDDWTILATEFPFLSLIVVLMDKEEGEEGGNPVVGFHVHEGKVVVFDPASVVAEEHLHYIKENRNDDLDLRSPLFGLANEHGIPWSWIEEWAERPRSLPL